VQSLGTLGGDGLPSETGLQTLAQVSNDYSNCSFHPGLFSNSPLLSQLPTGWDARKSREPAEIQGRVRVPLRFALPADGGGGRISGGEGQSQQATRLVSRWGLLRIKIKGVPRTGSRRWKITGKRSEFTRKKPRAVGSWDGISGKTKKVLRCARPFSAD